MGNVDVGEDGSWRLYLPDFRDRRRPAFRHVVMQRASALAAHLSSSLSASGLPPLALNETYSRNTLVLLDLIIERPENAKVAIVSLFALTRSRGDPLLPSVQPPV